MKTHHPRTNFSFQERTWPEFSTLEWLHVCYEAKRPNLKLKNAPGNSKVGRITVPLHSCLTGLKRIKIIDNFCFHLQNRPIQTSQTGGRWYSDTSPSVFPECTHAHKIIVRSFVKYNGGLLCQRIQQLS